MHIVIGQKSTNQIGRYMVESWHGFASSYRRREHSEGLRVIFGEYSDIVENEFLTMQRILDLSRFLYSRGWQVCITHLVLVPSITLTCNNAGFL